MPVQRITNAALAERIDAVNKYNGVQFDNLFNIIEKTNENITELNIKVGIQNGSVRQLKDDRAKHAALLERIAMIQATCKVKVDSLSDEYHADKDKESRNPVRWITNNWKQILIIAAIVAGIFMLFPGWPLKVWSIVSGTQLEIGY